MGVPPRVTPAQMSGSDASGSNLFSVATPLESWRYLWGALGYWLPAGINHAATALRYSKKARVS